MSNFIISRLVIPFVKLLYPKVDRRTQKEVKQDYIERVMRIEDRNKQIDSIFED